MARDPPTTATTASSSAATPSSKAAAPPSAYSSELADLALHPSFVVGCPVTVIHPQLRDLIACPQERGRLAYVKSKGIGEICVDVGRLERHHASGGRGTVTPTSGVGAGSRASFIPKMQTSTISSLLFTPNCLTTTPTLLAAGGQFGELHITTLPPLSSPDINYGLSRADRSSLALYHTPWSLTVTLPHTSINNSFLLLPPYRNEKGRASPLPTRPSSPDPRDRDRRDGPTGGGFGYRSSSSGQVTTGLGIATGPNTLPARQPSGGVSRRGVLGEESAAMTMHIHRDGARGVAEGEWTTVGRDSSIGSGGSNTRAASAERRRSAERRLRRTPGRRLVNGRVEYVDPSMVIDQDDEEFTYAGEEGSLPWLESLEGEEEEMEEDTRENVDGLEEEFGPRTFWRRRRRTEEDVVEYEDDMAVMRDGGEDLLRRAFLQDDTSLIGSGRYGSSGPFSASNRQSQRVHQPIYVSSTSGNHPRPPSGGSSSSTSNAGASHPYSRVSRSPPLCSSSRCPGVCSPRAHHGAPPEDEPRLLVSNNDMSVKMFAIRGASQSGSMSPPRTVDPCSLDIRIGASGRYGVDWESLGAGGGGRSGRSGSGSPRDHKLSRIGGTRLNTAVNHSSLSPDGKQMLVVGDTTAVYVYNVVGGGKEFAKVGQYKGSNDAGFSTSWSKDGRKFAVASQDGQVTVWDHRSSNPLARLFTNPVERRTQPSFSGDLTSYWDMVDSNGYIESYGSVSATGVRRDPARVVKFSPEGSDRDILVFSEEHDNIHIVDARTFDSVISLPVPYEVPLPGSNALSLPSERPRRGTEGGRIGISGLCFDPTGDFLYSGTESTIVEWDLRSARKRGTGSAAIA